MNDKTKRVTKPAAPAALLDPNQRYSIPEASGYMRICRARVYQKIANGELRVIKDGGRTFVPGTEIIAASRIA